jgi:hypothetical protein
MLFFNCEKQVVYIDVNVHKFGITMKDPKYYFHHKLLEIWRFHDEIRSFNPLAK